MNKEQAAKPPKRSSSDPLSAHLGISHEVVSPGLAVSRLKPEDFHRNSFGVINGAVLFAMADIGMGVALMSALGRRNKMATISMSSNFLRPCHDGEIVATSTVIDQGRKVATVMTEIEDGNGVQCAVMTGTYYIASGGEKA
tara:strand:- start:22 stop:444 length:423 start_codon:yes stop_codon:yes gene_type:complete